MRAARVLSIVLALAIAAVVAGAAASASGVKIRSAGGPVNALAMNGYRAAYDVGNPRVSHGTGNKVVVWDVRTGKGTVVSGRTTNAADITSTGRGVTGVAIAGPRVAWIVNGGGNTESDDYLCLSTVTRPHERKISTAMRTGPDPYQLQGNWIGHLVGSANVLAVNRWTTGRDGTITRAGLDIIGTLGLKRAASGAATLAAGSAYGSRIAIVRSNGTVGIYSTGGRLLLSVTPPSVREVALTGTYLVTLTKARTLEVYDAARGTHRKTLRTRGAALPANLDVSNGVAVYTAGRELHGASLTTGKDRVLATMSRGIKFAQLEPAGAVYAGNVFSRGRTLGTLTFVPFARVAAALR